MKISPIAATLRIFSAVLLIGGLTACDKGYDDALEAEIQVLSQQRDGSKPGQIAATDLITEFYTARDFEPVWDNEKKRETLRALVHDASSHGLNPEDYHVHLLDKPVGKSDEDKAKAEILYTDALVRLAYHLRFGKVNPSALDADWNYKRSLKEIEPVKALEELATAGDLVKAVEDFGPRMPEYDALRLALVQQYNLAETDNDPAVQQRIETLKVNLERMRWVAYGLPKDYVLVDIAGYNAALIRDGEPVWTSKVVVGKPYRETPIFRADMTQVILNPSWTVPPTILKEDLLAKVDSDPNIFTRKGLRIVDANGNEASEYSEGMRVTQAPGNDNALGRYKFDMPNQHTVYLHDTPAKDKFSADARAFSSGCIRLEKPRELAEILLKDQMSAQQIEEVIATNGTKTVKLTQKIPVLILYFTADAKGNVIEFRDDIYERDGRVAAALREPFKLGAVKA
jgi:murein L,D-transpeptidase YcbB/YkuD